MASGKLTTHVLDTSRGCPAAGLQLCLFELNNGATEKVLDTRTNSDGRVDHPLMEGTLKTGTYELRFMVAEYFKAQGIEEPHGAFLDEVPVRFVIAKPCQHYHVPLLLSPYGYSTYRGS
ncbi:hydroxyisourate hydrolase [Maritalea myrionectae]|mgnify:CR=1 FL=1|uniref:5-hydroxyisourate hydrolase n=1 Tax=Maritalea myrionectae TaxID=454601 RepID=A0A2R4M9I7_9HYPH|nr:hydroxyisourate hydrolase [Maritalea myrionectae]AVX02680.1 hydroxyisourate hydrolase [Maritalea myrionectae]